MKRLKVLISAYACSPYQGSEPGMAWGWVDALSQYHDLWVITEQNEFKADIEKKMTEQPEIGERIKFLYIPIHRNHRAERSYGPLFYRSYKRWQKKVYRLARVLNERVRFDLAHQLNMIGYREPGYLWKLDLPFVWGPVGGTADVPVRFASALGVKGFLHHCLRNAVNYCQLRYSTRVGAALARADGFVTATLDTSEVFLKVHTKRSAVISSTAVAQDEISAGGKIKGSHGLPIRLVYAGVHVSRKALPIVLRALSRLPEGCLWHFDIIGDGPRMKAWQNLASQLGIQAKCTWHGYLPTKADAVRIIEKADLFVFPSLQEGVPTVVLEALSKGLPVVCFDHHGMADLVDESCGIKIPVTATDIAVADFAKSLMKLLRNPQELERLSRGAYERAGRFTWQSRAELMLGVYEQALVNWRRKRGEGESKLSSDASAHSQYANCPS